MEEPKTAMELGLEQRMRAMTDATTAAFRAADRAITAGINSMNNFRAAVTIERTREVMDMYEDGLPFQLSGSGSFEDLYGEPIATTPVTANPATFYVTTNTAGAITTNTVTAGNINLSQFYCSVCHMWFATNEGLQAHVHYTAQHPITQLQCAGCGVEWSDYNLYMAHTRACHIRYGIASIQPSAPHNCHLCGEVFASIELGMEHIIAKHVPEKPSKFPPVKAKKTGQRQPRPDILPDEFIYEEDDE